MTPINACLRSLEMLQVTLTELVKKKKVTATITIKKKEKNIHHRFHTCVWGYNLTTKGAKCYCK